ncbi:death domain-associated protein 6-like [Branchiostoma lanceolatum]|uniref:death domain-associated protein 6-like n=1 Tax=Branchiostoma lanceolatum TaxID=7740 RepID=UPI00345392E6
MADGGEGVEIVVLSSDTEEKRLKSEPHANGTSPDSAAVKSEPTGGDCGVKSASKLSLKRKREISGTSDNGENSSEPGSVCAPNSDVLPTSSGPVEMVNLPSSSSEAQVQTKSDAVINSARAESAKKSFSEFVQLCSTLTKDKDVLKFLQKRFQAADSVYLSSQAFLDFLTKRSEKLKESGKKEVFVHMKAVIDNLKANKKCESGSEKGKGKRRRKGDQSGQDSSTEFSDTSDSSSAKRFKLDQLGLDETTSKGDKTKQNGVGGERNGQGKSEDDTGIDTEGSAVPSKEPLVSDQGKTSSAEDNPNNSSGDTETGQGAQASSSNGDAAESDRKAKKRQKQIRRLEKLLAIVSKEIKRLEAKEVSLDDLDDEDSTYIQEDRLKKRFNTIWNKLCELKGEEMVTGREVERTIKFKGTRFPEVNRRIMKFLRRIDAFPDFHDILAIIQKTNRKENLRLPPRHVHDLAKEAFTEIGDKFQRRRQRDLVQNFGSYLTDSFDPTSDPAKEDAELQQKLRDNRMHGKRRLDEVLEKYTRKQYEMHLDGETAQGSDTEDPPVRGEADVETEEDLDEDEMEDEEQLENSQVIEKVLEKADSEEEESMREITVVKPRKARKRFFPAFPDSDEGVGEDGTRAGIEGGSPVTFHQGSRCGDLLGETSGIGRVVCRTVDD